MRTRTKIAACAVVLLAASAAPAMALTRHDAVLAAAQAMPAAVGVPDAPTMFYERPVRLRGHHATFWATCHDDVLIGEAKVSVVEMPSGALHVHFTHARRWRLPQPDPAPTS